MANLTIDWNILSDNFKRNRKSLEIFCTPILLYNFFGGSLSNISILGISQNGSGLTRGWLILPTILFIMAYLTYRYWQSFRDIKGSMESNKKKLFDQYATELAAVLFSSRIEANQGCKIEVNNRKTIKVIARNRNPLEEHNLSEKEIKDIKLKVRTYLTTQKEGIYLEIYVPFFLVGATILAFLMNLFIGN